MQGDQSARKEEVEEEEEDKDRGASKESAVEEHHESYCAPESMKAPKSVKKAHARSSSDQIVVDCGVTLVNTKIFIGSL